jgi:hypothetical protein
MFHSGFLLQQYHSIQLVGYLALALGGAHFAQYGKQKTAMKMYIMLFSGETHLNVEVK